MSYLEVPHMRVSDTHIYIHTYIHIYLPVTVQNGIINMNAKFKETPINIYHVPNTKSPF